MEGNCGEYGEHLTRCATTDVRWHQHAIQLCVTDEYYVLNAPFATCAITLSCPSISSRTWLAQRQSHPTFNVSPTYSPSKP